MADKNPMVLARLRTGWTGPLHPDAVQGPVAPMRKAVYDRMLASGEAVPVCGVADDIKVAALCTAAAALGVTLVTNRRDVVEAAHAYGATVHASRAHSPKK